MNKQGSAGSTATNTVRLHRVLAAKPDKVYRAFTNADAMARWLPPNGFTCTVHADSRPAYERAALWHGKSLWCPHCFASQIAAAEAENRIYYGQGRPNTGHISPGDLPP